MLLSSKKRILALRPCICRTSCSKGMIREKAMHARAIGTERTVQVVGSEVAGAVGTLLFGIFVVFTVGFAGASVLHEAAHNARHSIAFPCH